MFFATVSKYLIMTTNHVCKLSYWFNPCCNWHHLVQLLLLFWDSSVRGTDDYPVHNIPSGLTFLLPFKNNFWAAKSPLLTALDQSKVWFSTIMLWFTLFALGLLLPVDDFSHPVTPLCLAILPACVDLIKKIAVGYLYSRSVDVDCCLMVNWFSLTIKAVNERRQSNTVVVKSWLYELYCNTYSIVISSAHFIRLRLFEQCKAKAVLPVFHS